MKDWVVDLIDQLGEFGVGLLIFLENVIPPIPSEIVLPFAGFAAESGRINVVLGWLAATIGSLAGALALYAVGAVIGEERIRHLSRRRAWIFFSENDFDRGKRWFDRHGGAVVFFARFIPLVRSIVSVPAGIDRMPLARFVPLTVAGSAIWNAVFIGAGWALGDRWDQVEDVVGPVSKAVVVVLVLAVLALVAHTVRRRAAASS